MPREPLTPERRKAMTREHLLAAAAEVFARDGYYGATLDTVAEAAGFTKGAVYSNFKSKADLFLALAADRERHLVEAFAVAMRADAPPDDLIARVRSVYAGADAEERDRNWRLWEEFLLFSLRDADARAKLVNHDRAAFKILVDLAQRRCDEAGVEPPVPVRLLAQIYIALFNGLWRQQVIDPDSVDDDAFGASLVFVNQAIAALGTPR